MHDFDVEAIGLDTPPSEAFKTTYRPAITVRNNGIHPANVTGSIAIINRDTGLQVFSSPVALANLAPGATDAAPALAEVTFADEGHYLAYGYVTTLHDSIPQNDNLYPVEFTVIPGTPTPPVVVPAHASQHENNGSDELEVEGLLGKLATKQDPTSHAAEHQVGGADQISIGGLSGKAAEAQTPTTHSNAYHNPTLATSAELTAHQGATAVHTAALNLANRETSGPEIGLVKGDQLAIGTQVDPVGERFLRSDRYWSSPMPQGAIITWPAATAIPAGWAALGVLPEPAPTLIRIYKL